MADSNFNLIFKRVEKKYLLQDEVYEKFLQRIAPYMHMDEHGLHTICNIYYDTEHFDLVRTSIEKPSYKEKLRLRSYGIPGENDDVFLELKKKYKGTVYKRRISMKLKEAENYLKHGIMPNRKSQILNEIDYFLHFYNPVGKVYLAYDRIAYIGNEDPDFRLTIDQNIRSRDYDLDLKKGDFGNPLLNHSEYLLEIKTLAALPLWLVEILSELKIYPVSFSKYGNIYKNEITTTRRKETCLQVS
ncbi:MAG: hypothetical protein K0R92_1248 [Lachnospiraceae bacterium]|nr:hypothetical protein [Lachnospiraceae bacterium]